MPQDYAGICAIVLAAGLAIGWSGSILIASYRGLPVGEQAVNLLSTLGGAMAGAIATYLGSMIRQVQRESGASRGYIYSDDGPKTNDQ